METKNLARYRIGVDLGGTKIEIAALDAKGVTCWRQRVATPGGDYAATVRTVAELVSAAESALEARGTVGVGAPGSESRRNGLRKNCNSTCLNGRPLKQDLESALGREIRIANDADCFALSEAVDGAGAGARVVFGVILGTGVGGGIVVERRLLSGPNGVAGEWGHNPLPWPRSAELPGPECYCGQRGCIETFLSGPGLAADHFRMTGALLSGAEVSARAAAGEAACVATVERYCERLARGLAHVINLIDPDRIVLGGGISRCAALYTRVPQLWHRHVFSDRVDTQLLPPVHGDSGGVRGAAWLWSGPSS